MTCRERCAGCPLTDRAVLSGRGAQGGIMVIGESPDGTDIQKRQPYAGQAGKLLRQTLLHERVGIHPRDVYFAYTVSCQMPMGKRPSQKMIAACRQSLYDEILAVNPTKLLLLGAAPVQALFQGTTISKIRGLGQYAHIPVTYKDVESFVWWPAWVPDSFIAEHEPVQDTGAQYEYVGIYRKRIVYVDTHAKGIETREGKKSTEYQLWRQKPVITRVPDQTKEIFTIATWSPHSLLRDATNFREYTFDIEKLARQEYPLAAPRIDTWIPRSVEEARQALSYIRQANILGCDTETTGLNPHTARLLSIGFGAVLEQDQEYDAVAVIIPKEVVYQVDVQDSIQDILNGRTHEGTLAFHNIKFDAQILHHAGYTLNHPNLIDTMMMAYAWDERPSITGEMGDAGGSRSQGRSLKTFGRIFYDIENYAFDFDTFFAAMDSNTVTDEEWDRLYTYHGLDCVLTAKLYDDLKIKLDEDSPKLLPLAQNISTPACLTFADVEYRGIRVDQPYLWSLRNTYIGKVQHDLEIINDFWTPKNLGARKKDGLSKTEIETLLSAYRIDTPDTERDTLLTRKAIMAKDDQRRNLIDALIQWRLDSKVISTYIDGILKRVWDDGRVHPQFVVDGTETGRVSSRNPNGQNIPSRTSVGKEIKRAFIPEEGMVFLSADYSQIQVRIAGSALFANEPKIKDAYLKKQDIYRVAAADVYHKSKDDITKEERSRAKSVVLGILFERSAHGLVNGAEMAEMLDRGEIPWTLDEAQAFQDEFFEQFPGVRAYIERQHAFALEHCYVEDPLGRRRRFPFIPPGGRDHFLRQTGNSPIQAGEAEVLLTGITRLHKILKRENLAHIVLSVHDSITSEVYPENVERVAEITKDALEQSPFPTDIDFLVDLEVGPDWSALMPIEQWIQENTYAGTL